MKTAICIASGPSLTQDDVDYCKGKGTVYLINDNYKLAAWADHLYACDLEWWDAHDGVPNFQGKKWTINHAAHLKYGLNYIEMDSKSKFSKDPSKLATGGNSGFQALNLAVLHGHERVILLGYDMKLGENRKRHWFGDHPASLNKSSNYHNWITAFQTALPFIDAHVINCTRDTALKCFEKAELRAIL